MTSRRRPMHGIPGRRAPIAAWAWLAMVTLCGCAQSEKKPRVETSALPRSMTFAVAPVLNYSGQPDLDPLRLADLLASELTYVRGAAVLPVSRVAAVLLSQGKTQVESPEHARALARQIGADAMIVGGVTEYDAYAPTVGLVLQLYLTDAAGSAPLDLGEARFRSSPYVAVRATPKAGPSAQVQGTYNAMHKSVVDRVREYARERSETDHPDGWRQYTQVQSLFIRFCWNDALRAMLDQDSWKRDLVAGTADVSETYHE
ncbi:MAG: hypothetical protein HBSAPP02_11670 [Phycisphaerae bacterium]|nr:MAG: hypothetical protein HBSAPP02_11670 [Phycisphaerae bacterium]